MALNPYFQQGSSSEQRLIQQLINEQLKMYGVEVAYIPRKFVRKETIIREVTSSKFNDNFMIEAYVNTYDGYSGAGDILTKFGMSLKDELNIVISRERFEDFISPFLESMNQDEITVTTRPREGDIIYFPLGKRLFEVKFVEHEKPFYQLGNLYVYELQCELFEYEDEIGGWEGMNTTVAEIDSVLKNQGYINDLSLFPYAYQATATVGLSSGYVRKITLNNDGYNYRSTPIVAISSAPVGGINAKAVAITSCKNGLCAIKEILLTNTGSGYTIAPSISIIGGGGSGASATGEIVTNSYGINNVAITTGGYGYINSPPITFSSPQLGGYSAYGKSIVGASNTISQILISDAGKGFNIGIGATVLIAQPPLPTGIGTYIFNEVVTGSISGAKASVKSWDSDTSILQVGMTSGTFTLGEIIVGSATSSKYTLQNYKVSNSSDKYEENDIIEQEADNIIDFSESNPFGTY
jgi:hypothetical protein